MMTTPEIAVEHITSGDNVFIHSVAAAPQALIKAMTQRHHELSDINIYHLHTEGPAPYCDPEFSDSFFVNAFFIGKNVRNAIQNGRGSYIPVFLSEAQYLFQKRIIPLDVALISVSPPDKHGYCSLGPSVDITLAAIKSARCVIAQVNRFMPRTHGDGIIHKDQINVYVPYNQPIPEVHSRPISDKDAKIGNYIAELIEDGSTLQMGIGAIPDAVLSCLEHHKDLGIHTEMFSNGMIPLVEKGVITGKYKRKHPGKIVSSFIMGNRDLYDFIDDNPLVVMRESGYVNNVTVIRKNPKVVAINSAIEVDLTGQVCADSIGKEMYSGVGGQMDFMRGAALSDGGKPIIAMQSVTSRGETKIVPTLKEGAGVVTTRAHVQYVVTEFGVANLYGKNLRQRAKALIDIAHPNHRERLEQEALEFIAG